MHLLYVLIKVLKVNQGSMATEHYITSLVVTHVLRVIVLHYVGSPCMKLEVIGHQRDQGRTWFLSFGS